MFIRCLLMCGVLAWAPQAHASCWAAFDAVPASPADLAHRTLDADGFQLPGETGRGPVCVWLVDEDRFLEGAATSCHPGVEACADITLSTPPGDLDGARAWVAIGEAPPTAVLLTTDGEPCGPRPSPGPSLGLVRASDPALPIALPLPGDDGGAMACAWTDPGPPIRLGPCEDGRPGCGTLDASTLQPGTQTLVVARGGASHTLEIAVADPRCAPPEPSDMGPSTPRRATRLNKDGNLEVTLAHPSPPDAEACIAFPESQPNRVPNRLLVEACEGGRARCVEVPLDLGSTWAVGSYPIDIAVGDAPVQRLSLHLPPPWWILIVLASFGFLLSTGGTLLAQSHLARARFARKLEAARARLRSQVEGNEPLVARVRALLGFARRRLSQPIGSLRRLVGLQHFNPALNEADQLLVLSGRKAALWRRATAQGLSPTARIRFNSLLRQLDQEILSLRLPMPTDTFAGTKLPSERAAEALLDDVELNFAADVRGNLDTLEVSLPPPIDEDEPIDLGPLLHRTRAEEQARLTALQLQNPLSPLAMREVDLRLDVLRSIEAALQDLVEGGALIDVVLVKRALRRWRSRDLREPQPADVHHDLLRALRWLPHNHRVEQRMRALTTPEARATAALHKPLLALVQAPTVWSTYRTVSLKVEVEDEKGDPHWLNDAYLWRRLLYVKWTVRCKNGPAPVQPGTAGEVDITDNGATLSWIGRGPEAAIFAVNEATLEVSAKVSAPTHGTPVWYDAASLAVRVERSEDERFLQSLQVDGVRRLLLNVGLLVGLIGLLAWQATEGRQGLLPYLWAFLLPFGVDLATLATPRLGQFASELFNKVYRA